MRCIAVALLVTGCSEWELNQMTEPNGLLADTDTGTAPIPDDDATCGDLDLDPTSISIDEACEIEAVVGTFTPVIEWKSTLPGAMYATPVVGQLTDDNSDGVIDSHDVPDIVAESFSTGTIYAFSGDGSGLHWQTTGIGAQPATPAIADIDDDGAPDIIISAGNTIAAYRGTDGAKLWTATTNLGGWGYAVGVGAYDLDGDGDVEIVLGNVILNGKNGSPRGKGALGVGSGQVWGYAAFGVAADIDQDGDLEVVVGNALYDADGKTIWGNGQSDGFVAVANFDADARGEIVVSGGYGNIRLQDDDGKVIWAKNVGNNYIGPPTVADFDGDGEPEIGVSSYGYYRVLEADGTEKWTHPIQDYSSGYTGSSVFDFEGDGKAEVVFADERDVWVFDGATGNVKLRETHHSSATAAEYPVVADVDADGHAEIVYASGPYDSGTEQGITVIGDADNSWMAGRPIWNQHAYAITNVDDVGNVPAKPDTNWLTYNNFRSGDVTAVSGSKSADAIPIEGDVCLDDCDEGHLRVVVRLGNGGMDDLPLGTLVSAYAFDGSNWILLDTRDTNAPLAPGETTLGFEFDLNPADIPDGKLKFVVDDDGTGAGLIDECHEENNELEIEVACP